MPEIEFIDPEPPSEPTGVTPRRTLRLGGVIDAVPPLLCAIGAAVAVAAPFQHTTTLSFPGDETGSASGLTRQVERFDGWGRVRITGMPQPSGDHQIRYGILLCVCAGLLVVAALAFVAALLGSQRAGVLRSIARGVALLGAGSAAAISAISYLDFLSLHDSVYLQAAQADSGLSDFTIGFGPFVWLAAGAGVLALLAVLASAISGRLTRRFSAQPQPEPGMALYAAGWPDGGDTP